MDIISGETYHIYNQGNNKETIFQTEENYLYFFNAFPKISLALLQSFFLLFNAQSFSFFNPRYS